MRIVLGILVLAAGVGATLLGFAAPPSWKTPELVAAPSPIDPNASRLQAISQIGTLVAQPEATNTGSTLAGVPVADVQTTVAAAKPPMARPTANTSTGAWPATVSLAPSDPVTLVRGIQSELSRLGCYAGPVDGHWSPATQQAAARLVSGSNASLPVDQPDVVLLSLAGAAGADQACGPAVAVVERQIERPAMTLGGPRSEEQVAPRRPAAYRTDRDVQSLFTNPLGR